ncbi:MAG: acyl-CoA dehydrogenase family protein [Sphingomonadales bacterium]
MDFNFTPEQDMLRDTAARFFTDHYDFAQRQAACRSQAGWRPEIWRMLAQDLGIFGASFSEDLGGLGGGAIENMIVMEEIGKALVVEPYLDTVVIGGGLLRRAGGAAAAALIQRIISGDVRLAFAHLEPDCRYDLAEIGLRAVAEGGHWRLSGVKDAVAGAPFASHLIVTGRVAGGQRDRDGIGVFLVRADDAGLAIRDYATVDGTRAADIRFDGALAQPLGEPGTDFALLEAATDDGVAALCAEALGVMRRLLADTLAYAKERKQFGAPIGSNQALQHRMADMYVALEQAVSMTYVAAMMLERPAADRIRAVSAAKVYVGKAARFVGQSAIQIHGGMGMTDELAVSHYFKRAAMIEHQLGGVDYHLARME